MTMYAEERQQAMAQLVARARPPVGDRARRAVTTSPPRPSAATCPPSSGSGLVRRVHGGAVPANSLTVIEAGLASATRPTPREKERIAEAALDLLPPPGSTVLIDAGSTTSRLAALLPRDHRAHRGDPRRAGRRPARRQPPDRAAPAARGGSARRTQAAVGADTVAALGRAPRRRRVPRHQRDHRRATASPRPTATRPRPSGRWSPARADGRGARRLQQGRHRDADPVRRARRGRRRSSPTPGSPPPTARALEPRRPRGGGRMIITLTANPSHDRTVTLDRAAVQRGAVQRAASVISQAGGKGVNISRASVAAGRPVDRGPPGPQGRPVRARAARRRHRLPAGRTTPATSASTSRSASPTAPPPSSTAPAPR